MDPMVQGIAIYGVAVSLVLVLLLMVFIGFCISANVTDRGGVKAVGCVPEAGNGGSQKMHLYYIGIDWVDFFSERLNN